MKKFITNNTTILTLGIFFVILVWYLISLGFGNNNLIFPNPIQVFSNFVYQLTRVYIYQSIGYTLLRTLIGFAISFALAIILGSLSGNFPKLNLFLKPLLIVLKSAPTAAFVFFFLVLSGSTYAPIYVVILLSFPILYESVVGGFKSIPKEIIDASRVDGSNQLSTMLRIKLPLSLPYIIVGLASSFALSIKTEIMAELISGDTDFGLGCAIRNARTEHVGDMTPIFAIALIAIILVMIFSLISYIVKKILDKNK